LLTIAVAVSGGAILRAAARVFLGWGPKHDPLLTRQPEEESPTTEQAHPLLLVVTGITLALGLAISLVPGLGQRAEYGAARFRNRAAYAQQVLHGKPVPTTKRLPFAIEPTSTESVLYGIGGAVLALVTAAFGLWRRRLPEALRALGDRALRPAVEVLRAAHSGVIGDYVMWLTVGTAVIGGVWAITLR
jgi:multicomponent Na+:H+ antiporter subunit D